MQVVIDNLQASWDAFQTPWGAVVGLEGAPGGPRRVRGLASDKLAGRPWALVELVWAPDVSPMNPSSRIFEPPTQLTELPNWSKGPSACPVMGARRAQAELDVLPLHKDAGYY